MSYRSTVKTKRKASQSSAVNPSLTHDASPRDLDDFAVQRRIRQEVDAMFTPQTVMNKVNPYVFGSTPYFYFSQFWAEKLTSK